MKIHYAFMRHAEDEENIECDSCGFPAPLYEFDVGILDRARKALFCELCANSKISHAFTYPDQFPDRNTMFAVAYVGNTILTFLGMFGSVEHIILPPESED